jgi:hypothetical protein
MFRVGDFNPDAEFHQVVREIPQGRVTVNVAANAPPEVVNQVSVLLAGLPVASVSDITTILAMAHQQALQLITVSPCRVLNTRNPLAAMTHSLPFALGLEGRKPHRKCGSSLGPLSPNVQIRAS